MAVKVYIDPACNINYSSFYLIGLRKIYGRCNIIFTSRFFKNLHYSTDCHNLAFVIDGKKYVIDFADSNALFHKDFLEWADVYGKVNYNKQHLPLLYADKIIPVGANYGMACYGTNKYQSLFWCLWHYLLSYNRLKYSFRSFLSPYLWVYKQQPISKIKPIGPSNTIFMVSRYWHKENCVNQHRINFIRQCMRLEKEGVIRFIGGLIPDSKVHDCPTDVLLDQEIPKSEYLHGIQHSLLVFNTPAYHNCHGWKLPEYISQGCIILSLPFVNELPVPMEHGKNIFFSEDNEQAIYQSILTIVSDSQLQSRLREGCAKYWQQYASPEACVRYFLKGSL